MKIVHVSFDYDERLQSEEELLEKHYTVTGLAEALQRNGAEVIVINRFNKNSFLQKNNVQYHFVCDRLPAKIRSWHLPLKFLKEIRKLDVDIVHLHHLSLCIQTFTLRLLLKSKTAIIIQHHGGPPPTKIRRTVYSMFNSCADGYFFTAAEQGNNWFKREKQLSKIMSVMEGATFFDYATRDASRALTYSRDRIRNKTGMHESPVFLWVGNLNPRKDPLTVLEGFKELFAGGQDGRFFMVYSDEELLGQIQQEIQASTILRKHVHLVTKVSRSEMEIYYSSADYFVLGSHAEGSGYALSEALSCGCVPIVTNIPSFRMMTNNGQLGALWSPGDKNSFVQAAKMTLRKDLAEEAQACINFYKEKLSFDAIAKMAIANYKEIISNRLREKGNTIH